MSSELVFSYLMLRWSATATFSVALFLLAWAIVTDPENAIQRSWARYCASIERKLYKMFIWTPGYRVATGQLAVILAACVAKLMITFPMMLLLGIVFAAAFGPEVWLTRALHKRMTQIDQQVDGFLVALSNALKSRPSIADAISSISTVITNPIRQEVELVVKQMRVGSTVDQALLAMSGRVGSRRFDAAISAILVGRQVGGNVSQILDTIAASMREMARLEGVVRTKTADGRAQIWVLAAFPFLLIFGFSLASPGYFDPLSETVLGYACAVLGFGLWGASIISARKILRVDL